MRVFCAYLYSLETFSVPGDRALFPQVQRGFSIDGWRRTPVDVPITGFPQVDISGVSPNDKKLRRDCRRGGSSRTKALWTSSGR
jgi:hypothetical protein